MSAAPLPLTAPPTPERPALLDGQGRRVTYLRLSLTDRCNFHCSYCAPAAREGPGPIMSRREIRRLAGVFAAMGVRRVRLTGGEPTLRPDLLEIVADVRGTPGIEEVALTTNGHLLADLARPLVKAGVSRLNVSLDTLDPARLQRLAGPKATLARVTRGLAEAARAGFASLKTNAVVVRGENQDELGDLARFAWRHGATARFIELMPFGPGEPVPVAEVKRLLEAQGIRLSADEARGWGPARHMRGESEVGSERLSGLVGFIGAMTESFCDSCNRVRVAADGSLRACLGGRERVPLLDLLRGGADDAALAAAVRQALSAKGARHALADGPPAAGSMMGIGG